jgi:Ca-activated chloride channel family protein
VFDGGSWELRDPLFLMAGLAAPIVYALAARPSSAVTYSSLALVDSAARSWRTRVARLPAWLLAAAVVALAIALAGPRTGDATSRIRREGIAIAMVVDRSGSMQARDFVRGNASISRLAVVKEVFRRFVAGERGGLCPLTLDHGNLLSILADVEIVSERTEDGTAIGEGLALAVERLRGLAVSSKVAILLTDGVNNAGDIDPLHAADLAAQYGIKVYAIGAGSSGLAPVPVQLPDGRTMLRQAYVEIDEATLRQIAERTGGRYFHAASASGLAEVIEEIDRLERSEVTEIRYLTYEYHHARLVGGALLAIAGAALLSGTALRRLP